MCNCGIFCQCCQVRSTRRLQDSKRWSSAVYTSNICPVYRTTSKMVNILFYAPKDWSVCPYVCLVLCPGCYFGLHGSLQLLGTAHKCIKMTCHMYTVIFLCSEELAQLLNTWRHVPNIYLPVSNVKVTIRLYKVTLSCIYTVQIHIGGLLAETAVSEVCICTGYSLLKKMHNWGQVKKSAWLHLKWGSCIK